MNFPRNLAVKLMFILVVTFESDAIHNDDEQSMERIPESLGTSDPTSGQPLYLTPLLEAGQADSARRQARVSHPKVPDIESFAGYFTVNKNSSSHLFFWYFPAKENSTTAPVVLHLEGRLGLSMMFGVALENGPFSIKGDSVEMRKKSWNNKQNVIYMDPIETGYSFGESHRGRSYSYFEIAEDLLQALRQFFQLFPSLRENDFFVAGDGHAGFTITSLAYLIGRHNVNTNANGYINLTGIMISNSIMTPINQLHKSEYLYEFGLVDANGKDQLQNQHLATDNYVSDLVGQQSLIHELTDYDYSSNILRVREKSDVGFSTWVTRTDVRRALHVGSNEFAKDSEELANRLKRHETPRDARLLCMLSNAYQVLIYTGQLNMVNPYHSVRNFFETYAWSGASKFKTAKRQQWRVASGELAGYITKAGNLTGVLVRNAGDFPSLDQPEWTLELVERFTHGLL